MSKNKNTRKALIGMGILATAFLGVASAVNLGVEANNELAAGVSVTATCQPAGASNDINVGFSTPTYVAATQGFTVNSVALSNIAVPCNGQHVKVVVSDASGAALGTYTGTVSGTSLTATMPAPVDSAAVKSVSVVIYGD